MRGLNGHAPVAAGEFIAVFYLEPCSAGRRCEDLVERPLETMSALREPGSGL